MIVTLKTMERDLNNYKYGAASGIIEANQTIEKFLRDSSRLITRQFLGKSS